MVKEELITRSPLRILEQSIHGGLGNGNIGVIAARKGVGKTACLVNFAADLMLQGKQVIHVSFSENTNHIIAWYEDIFTELANRFRLGNASHLHDNFLKNRIIMNFNQDTIDQKKIEKSILTTVENCAFNPNTIVLDDYDFSKSSAADLQSFKNFASQLNLELWFSASVPDDQGYFDGSSIPEMILPLIDEISIVICLQPRDHFIHLNLIKDHDAETVGDPHLKLNPNILLIAEEI